MHPQNARRRLIRHGFTLFLLGLLTGFAMPAMHNTRAGLAAHLEGVMNGTFLIAVALAWSEIQLPPRPARVAFALILYGTYANWTATTASAVFGTSKGTPIAGAGFQGNPIAETLVYAGLASVGVTMLIGCAILVWGAWRASSES
jgi:hydroxylaminobenzene mutase